MSPNPQQPLMDLIPILNVLSSDQFEQIKKISEYKIVKKYNFVYLQGEAADKIYFLVKGSLKLGNHSDDGREVIKTILHAPTIFGEMSLVSENKRKEFAQAMKEDVHFFVLRAEDFRRLMQTNFKLTNNILTIIGNRLRNTEARLESFVFHDARTRIVDFLKRCAQERGRQVGFETLFKHSLTQQDIANITGTSRQTVTSVLNDLKKSNMIYFNRRSILIRDLSTLA